jgi:hypothetical protein
VSEKDVTKALTALNQASIRQLEIAGDRLLQRRDGLQAFGQVFKDVANERDGGFGQARYHLRNAIEGMDERTEQQVENARAPFWRHVREALAERHP